MSEPWWKEFGQAFWITIAGVFAGAIGVCVRGFMKSRCSQVQCWGFSCTRDTSAEVAEHEFDVEHGIQARL
jgi:hypothetical protein